MMASTTERLADQARASLLAARLELNEVNPPPMQVRDALKRIEDSIGWLEEIILEQRGDA